MLINAVTIESLSFANARLSWSGTAGATVRVYLNGLLSFGPQAIADADKSIVVSTPEPAIIEIHETDAAESVKPIIIPLSRKPLVWWTSRTGALEYKIYWGEQLLKVVTHDASKLHHEHQLVRDLRQDGGTWTGLRVEAVTPHGQESVRAEFPVYAPGLPLAPTALFVTGTGGAFNFYLNEEPPSSEVPELNEDEQPSLNEDEDQIYVLPP